MTSIFTTPDLVTYRSKIDHTLLDTNARSSRVELGSDLVVPYSHQYNFNWEKQLTADWRLQLGYVGSRSHKLIITYFMNRAREIPGLDSTIVNINERRADRSIYEHLFTHNGSRGYFDAGRVSIVAPSFKGLSLNASYWISKSIDLGRAVSRKYRRSELQGFVADASQVNYWFRIRCKTGCFSNGNRVTK